ncbi:DUF389 domain-containing protein [Agromyces sp. LHK192]|uniref:DUF389 domain-containing protein n=1 Tax=Agromyces sp. LHK192 TaxID=2498704 RepID=UPI0013E3FCEF|nr:DUF389 domain-containing protein [Agromyces sp. LHK192]
MSDVPPPQRPSSPSPAAPEDPTPPPSDALNTIAHMRDAVLFDGPHRTRRISRFWMLLILSAVIASAGVVADSTATVIGAMIVAPMMIPIQGTMLSTVLGDRGNLTRSFLMMVAGAAAAIAVGYLVAMLVSNPMTAETNSQIAGRVSPKLIDLLAALATGVVGSIALVRKDISDTLPGVAIAISLVPPLTVVGIAAESGAVDQSLGALLLFLTNVAAILGTGIVVMALFGVQRWGIDRAKAPVVGQMSRRSSYLAIFAMLVIVAIPLTFTSVRTSGEAVLEDRVGDLARQWADDVDWDLVSVTATDDGVLVRVTGPEPVPDPYALVEAITDAGIDPADVEVDFIPSYRVNLGE